MKLLRNFSVLLALCFVVLNCSVTKGPTVFNPNDVEEHWQNKIEKNADAWKIGASRWFLLGEPNDIEKANRNARGAGMSTQMIDTGPFTEIHTNGNYQLQIFGSDHFSVFVYGPQAAIQAVSLRVSGDTLMISQDRPIPIALMERVIVRVGVPKLHGLTQAGAGRIEAIHIVSPDLCISAPGSGKIYLAGHYRLKRINHTGNACIYLFGASSKRLEILSAGGGLLNISGRVGIRSIRHTGTGEINIIGAYSHGLDIDTSGSGKIALCGNVRLCSICASGKTCTYLSDVRNHRHISLKLKDFAVVGLAGRVRTLNVNASCGAKFYGRYLCALNTYTYASDRAHLNISAANRAFVGATDNATVYFYGETKALENMASDYAAIFTMPHLCSCRWYNIPATPPLENRSNLRGQG